MLPYNSNTGAENQKQFTNGSRVSRCRIFLVSSLLLNIMLFATCIVNGVFNYAYSRYFDTPIAALTRIKECHARGAHDEVWDAYEGKSQGRLEYILQNTLEVEQLHNRNMDKSGVLQSSVLDADGRDLYILLCKAGRIRNYLIMNYIDDSPIACTIKGDTANILMRSSSGIRRDDKTIIMKRSGGKWKLVISIDAMLMK